MPDHGPQYWDDRYRAAGDTVWGVEPNLFVAAELAALPAGTAVDLACGEGRNAIWLASRGWQVTAADFSQVAIDRGRALAADRQLAGSVEWICADATTWHPPAADLVLLCYLQLTAPALRSALENAAGALRPGGTLLVVAHDSRNLTEGVGGPQDRTVLYSPTDVTAVLAGSSGLQIERADTVERPVAGSDRPALDVLVRARRA